MLRRSSIGKNSKSSSGIGLSVAYEIIKRHGGELDIETALARAPRYI